MYYAVERGTISASRKPPERFEDNSWDRTSFHTTSKKIAEAVQHAYFAGKRDGRQEKAEEVAETIKAAIGL